MSLLQRVGSCSGQAKSIATPRHIVNTSACVQAMAWFHEDDDGEALLEAMCRWCICLPHMMLFHVCEGHDMQVILKVRIVSAPG